jgi:hypothetical protein
VIGWFLARRKRWRIIAVADEAVFIIEATAWTRWEPKRLLQVLPRNLAFGPVHGVYARIRVADEWLWVPWRFFAEVRAADADLDRLGLTPHEWSGPPSRKDRLARMSVEWAASEPPGSFTATMDEEQWLLTIDPSNQGTRYIAVSASGARFELPYLPDSWVLRSDS